MLDDDGAALEVGFAIDTSGSFDSLMQLQEVMNSTEAKVLADATRIERATSSMVNLAPATAAIEAFAPAATRELRAVAREAAAVERSGEGLVRSLERQAASFGKTRDELRSMRAEEKALAADRVGNTDLAQRIRAAEAAIYDQQFAAARRAKAEAEAFAEEQMQAAQKAAAAAEIEAQARRDAAHAHNLFEAAARRGMAAYREQQALEAAAERDTKAAALRAETLATQALERARKALADQLRETHAAQLADAAAAERLRASTDPLYAATVRINAEIAESTRLYHVGATAPAEYARQQQVLIGRLTEAQAAHNATTAAVRRGSGALTQLSFQANDVITMAMSGSGVFQIFATQIGQIVQVFQMAEGGAKGVAAELGGLFLRFLPLIGIVGAAAGGFMLFDRAVSKGVDTKAMVESLGLTRDEIKKLKDTSVDTGDVVTATFQVLAQRVGLSLGDMTGFFGKAMDYLTKVGADAMAGLYAGIVGTFEMISIAAQAISERKSFSQFVDDVDKSMAARFDQARGALNRFGEDVTKTIASNKLAELKKQADEIKKDRTPKTDRHAQQLERESRAIEAQIRNLYALADAYGVSGAAALIAEARVKAESEAIKKRADIEARVDQQIRLAIAQRVSDAFKEAAAMRDQAQILAEVNAEVAMGNVHSERAGALVQQRIAELPLLAAIEAAQQRGLTAEVERATRALEEQRDAQRRVDAAEIGSRFASADADADRQLAVMREELRLVGATDEARTRALTTIRATQDAQKQGFTGAYLDDYVAKQVAIALGQVQLTQAQEAYNEELTATADLFDLIDSTAQRAASGIADAFGRAGAAIGDVLTTMTGYYATQERLRVAHQAQVTKFAGNQRQIDRENYRFALQSSSAQIGAYGDMAAAAKGFFEEGSDGYKALQAAETVYRVAQLAMSLSAMIQNSAETTAHVANAGARAAADGAAGVAAQAKLPFPANIAAMAATAAALTAVGITLAGAIGGRSRNTLPAANTGTGTILGDSKAQSESVRRAIDQLRDVNRLTNTFARQMAGSLRSIDSQIGGLAAVLVRSGNVNANASVAEGFKPNTIGKMLGAIPLIGGVLSSLFGSKQTVIASGLYGRAQSIGQIRAGGFDASTYSDIEKKKKFLGITTGTSYSTQYGKVDAALEQQFGLVLTSFASAIAGAAVPLGEATNTIEARLNGFVVDIGKIDLKGLTGTEIQEKLEAVFGAAADNMANAAFPGFERFQKVGEGAFETLVRVASTAEAVTNALAQMGSAAHSMSLDAKLGLADQFDSIGDLTSAIGSYFEAFYTPAEQAAAKTAELSRVFGDLGLTMPASLAAYRQLVDAQDLNTAAGQAAYATLIQLAPAFAELQESMAGAKSAVDVAAERADLERQLLELRGDTAAIRALELAKLDASNRELQQQIYALQDAKEAAAAADELRQAWTSVGDSIMDEVERIRGISSDEAGSFAAILGRFNAANAAARGGDLDAAEALPQLSQALLAAAADAATSRQELDRVRAQTAAQLEATYSAIGGQSTSATSAAALLAGASTAQAAATAPAANDDAAAELRAIRLEIAGMRSENRDGHAATASNTGRTARTLDSVTAASGGEAIATVVEARAA